MKNVKLNCFTIFSLSWISLALINLFLIIFGWFNTFTLLASVIFIVLKLFWLIKKEKIEITPMELSAKIILVAIITLGIILSLRTNPTVFGGRDEGSYSINAILMSQTGGWKYNSGLINEFFRIYGPGKALNFPGFYYTDSGQLKSQFLPAYSSWLAIWYKSFGLIGLKFANLFPLVTFIFSFYLLLKKLLASVKFGEKKKEFSKKAKNASFWSTLFLLSCLPLIMFYKFTLGEIFFGALIWFSLYLLVSYFQNKNRFNYWLVFLPLFLIPFARIESLPLIFMLLIILIWKDFQNFRQARFQLPFVILGLLFVLIFYLEPNFFINSLKNLFQPFIENKIPTLQSAPENTSLIEDWKEFYLPGIFFIYNFAPFILMGGIFLLNFLRKKEREKISDIKLFFPLFILWPTLIYFVDANISLDHPWLLRRYLFTIIPLFIFYSGFFLFQIKIKKSWLGNFIIGLIFAINLFLIFPNFSTFLNGQNFIFYSQNPNLLKEVQFLAEKFGPQDLILVSQKSSGSGWSLLAEPLRTIYDRQAIYFFNPFNLEKINRQKYENIYLLTSEDELDLYKNIPKKEIEKYDIENDFILPSRDLKSIAKPLQFKTQGIIYEIE